MAGRIDGVALGAIAAGSVFIVSGLRGVSVLKTLQSIVRGQAPPQGSPAAASSAGPAPGIGAGVAGAGHLTPAQIKALWLGNGGDPAQAQNATCHAMQESSGDPAVTSANPDGGVNVGLWQLDTRGKGAGYTVAQLQDPVTNARVTIMATRNGRDWSAWATPGC